LTTTDKKCLTRQEKVAIKEKAPPPDPLSAPDAKVEGGNTPLEGGALEGGAKPLEGGDKPPALLSTRLWVPT
jgi:hypothetical protein